MMQINNSFQKNANMSMAARLLWRYPGISRIDIAKRLGVYRSTISNIINALVDNGVVLESRDKTGSTLGGRKPLRLTLNPDFGCVIGIELQPSGYTIVVTDFIGVVRFSRSGPLPEGPFERLPERILEETDADIRTVGLSPLAICVGMPGIINSCEGLVVRSDIFNARNVTFPRSMPFGNSLPLYIENEANCIAWQELLRKRTNTCRSLLCVNTEYTRDASRFSQCNGLAIGVGVAFDGRVYGGSHSAAGEFVSSRWNSKNGGQGNFVVPSGDGPIDQAVLAEWIRELFESLVPVISVFDPHAIIIHGELARHRIDVQRMLDHEVPRFGDILKRTGCELVFSDGDPRSVAIGAAHMFLMRLFSLPVMDEDSHQCQNWGTVFDCTRRIGPDAIK